MVALMFFLYTKFSFSFFSLIVNKITPEECKLALRLSDKKPINFRLKYGKANNGIMKIVTSFSIEWFEEIVLITTNYIHFVYDGNAYIFVLEAFDREDQIFPLNVYQSEAFIPIKSKNFDKTFRTVRN